jgi:hypothetical protein
MRDGAMGGWRYRCVAAPRKAKASRAHRAPADALLAAIEAAIAAEAAQGWEYVRTDLVPMESKAGFFGPVSETHLGVMVFRRPADAAPAPSLRAEIEAEAPPPRLGAARGE